MAQKRCRIIFRLSVSLPCVIPMKSSRYTLTWARDVACACRGRDSQLQLDFSVAADFYFVDFGGLVCAKSLRWYGGAVLRLERVSSAWSLTVLVVA